MKPYTKRDFDDGYRVRHHTPYGEVTLGYCRYFFQAQCEAARKRIERKYPWTIGSTCVDVGGAFGWAVEGRKAQSLVVDPSPYVAEYSTRVSEDYLWPWIKREHLDEDAEMGMIAHLDGGPPMKVPLINMGIGDAGVADAIYEQMPQVGFVLVKSVLEHEPIEQVGWFLERCLRICPRVVLHYAVREDSDERVKSPNWLSREQLEPLLPKGVFLVTPGD